MTRPKAAAIDYGKTRVGVAVSDDLGLMSHPRPALDGRNHKALLAALVALAKEEQLTRFIVGYPLEMNGDEGPSARRARKFAGDVANATGLEVELMDERWSTKEAARQLRDSGRDARKSKDAIDGVSAAVLLQSWLDAGR